jgi:histidyl-tRNA synthetase
MKVKAIRGVKDILPKEFPIWNFIEDAAKRLFKLYGYQPISTPVLEQASLFTRSIGVGSDIVRKEMYCFFDRKKRQLCLRPEATASVVRAYLEHGLDKNTTVAKFYYFGPMFRAERPQAGRLRQFHHIGVEAIGSLSPFLDAEIILLASNLLEKVGLKRVDLQLNSIGCQKDRQEYKSILQKELKNKLKFLCSDCHSRYQVNLLRIFDCKNENCQRITFKLSTIINTLCSQCNEHFQEVKKILDSLNIAYILNPRLVRGLDYYTKTCFEFTHPHLGAQNAVGAGGRYDDLVKDLGGPAKPAVGFALGIERLIAALIPITEQSNESAPCVFFATLGPEAKQLAFKLMRSLRKQGIATAMDYDDKSLKSQMRQADKLQAQYVAILGAEEIKKQIVILRDMQNKTQKEIAIKNLAERLR